MNYVRISNKEIITKQTILNENLNVSFPKDLTDELLKPFGYAILYDVEQPECGLYEKLEQLDPIIIDNKYYRNYSIISIIPTKEPELDMFIFTEKNKYKQEVANRRYNREIAGIKLPNDQIIRTDRESQSQLNGAYTGLKNNFITSTWWKTENGWALVTLEDIEPIAIMVADYVRGCFEIEKMHNDWINEITNIDQLLDYVNNKLDLNW